jgi:iron complex outermembrane receptor protein
MTLSPLQPSRSGPSISAACTLALLAATPATAQVIEEIIVTAQKREQSLQDVPIAISAFDANTLRRAGVRDLRDITALSPSLILTSTQSETAGTTARIRGVGTTGDNLGLESSVGVFIDGVYRNRNNVALTELGELERIEVLRGPQGTLFGKNASAGLIQIITRRPDTEQFDAYVEGGLGNYTLKRFAGGVTGPVLGEQLALRLDATYVERDGFIENVLTGERYNDRDRYLLRGQATSQITPDLDLRLIVDYSKREETCCAAVSVINGPAIGAIAAVGGAVINPASPFKRQMTANSERGYLQDVEEKGVSAEFNWDLGFATLTSITAWREWEADRSLDADFSSADILYRAPGTYANSFDTVTQELRLAGTSGPLQWLVGFFYVDEELEARDAIRTGRDYENYFNAVLFGATNIPNLLTSTISGLPGWPAGLPVFADGRGAQRDFYRQQADSWALFTHNIWSINERFDLTLGLRYTEEEKKLNAQLEADNPACLAVAQALVGGASIPSQIIGIACLPLINPLVDGSYAGKRKDSELTGTLSLGYDLTDAWRSYVSYSRGYKAGGYNLDRGGLPNPLLGTQPSAGSLEFEPETVDSYEIGAKGSLWDNRITLNLAAFLAQFKDFQLNTFTGTNFIVSSVKEVESKGIEAEAQFAATDRLSFLGGLAYTDARYDNSLDNPALAGRRVTNSPYWTATGAMAYEHPLPNNLLAFFNLDFRFNGNMNTGSDLKPEKRQPSYTVWNGRMGFGPDDERWILEVWGRNLLDQDYRQVVIDTPLQTGSFAAFLGDPRTYGVTLRVNFR